MKKQIFLSKHDEADIIRSIYTSAFVQFVAIVVSVVAIVKLILT